MLQQPLHVILSARLGKPTDQERRITGHGAALTGAVLADREAILRNASDATLVILGAVEPFDRTVLAGLPRLAAVVRRGVGVDNVDVDAATELGIVVANVPDASVHEVADHALALLVTLERRIGTLDRSVRRGQWRDDPAALQRTRTAARRLSTLTLGVIGFGRIGRALAARGAGIYDRVVAADPALPAGGRPDGVEIRTLSDVLATADHVSLHLPYSAGARHLVGPVELAAMRPGAVLVNTARGGIVDEAAVVAALRSGHLAGAGLDVTEREPLPDDDPLLDVTDGLLLTGHAAAWSVTAADSLARASVDAAIDILAGKAPASLVNPRVLRSAALRASALRSSSR